MSKTSNVASAKSVTTVVVRQTSTGRWSIYVADAACWCGLFETEEKAEKVARQFRLDRSKEK